MILCLLPPHNPFLSQRGGTLLFSHNWYTFTFPLTTTIQANKRIIDNGRIIVSAGISAGIDMSLYVVAKLLGKEQALETAQYMEYDWNVDPDRILLTERS